MQRIVTTILLLPLTLTPAWADEAPEPVASSPWAAIAIFAVVIGMIAGIIIWRRRR
jgi:ElaB/YqjD/DUF883 family membrane-anchored ribosome-binding protein